MEKIIYKNIKSCKDYIDCEEYLVVADMKLRELYPDIFPERTIFIEAGESAKSERVLFYILKKMSEFNLTRNATLYLVGGGTISDVGGLAAGLYMRGIDHVIVPTTLLSITDASIGGKCAINFNDYKNNVGIFKEPREVIIDSNFTKTLDEMVFNDGLVEGFKIATLFDREVSIYLFSLLNSGRTDELVKELSNYAPKKKSEVVELDFREKGIRTLLNAGHTVAHFLEEYYDYNISHGKAVAIGLFLESMLGFSDFEVTEFYSNFYYKLYNKLDLDENIRFSFDGDKKSIDSHFINLPVVTNLGRAKVFKVEKRWLEESLENILKKI